MAVKRSPGRWVMLRWWLRGIVGMFSWSLGEEVCSEVELRCGGACFSGVVGERFGLRCVVWRLNS